jgi:tetratricopeptide (TPR) repeat protein
VIRSRFLFMVMLVLTLATFAAAAVSEILWVPRGTETYNLDEVESLQLRVTFDDLAVRAWILEVDGDLRTCDLNVLALNDLSLLYQKNNESRHRVRIPWGRGQRVAVTLTADMKVGGVFTVKFLAPPPEQAGRAFGYIVNRALEALESGKAGLAESLLYDSIKAAEDEGVALLLLAGLAKENGDPEKAAGLLNQAVRYPLPKDLNDVRAELERQLSDVMHRPEWMTDADLKLAEGDASDARRLLDKVLADKGGELSGWELSELHRRAGAAAQVDEDLFVAQEHFDRALSTAQSTRQRALCLHGMGLLQRDLGNPHQARQALRMARELGLPLELDAEAAAQLAALETQEQ